MTRDYYHNYHICLVIMGAMALEDVSSAYIQKLEPYLSMPVKNPQCLNILLSVSDFKLTLFHKKLILKR